MRKITLVVFVPMVLAGLLPASALSFGLILNGGFEEPYLDSWAHPYMAGSTDITNWEIVSGSVDIVVYDYWWPYSGRQSLDLDGVSAGTIEQSFPTVPGETYWLSFAYSNNGGAWAPPTADVDVIGNAGSTLLHWEISHWGSSPHDMNYSLFLESFVADDLTGRLRFTSTDDFVYYGIVLDGVGVYTTPTLPDPSPYPIPEPASLLLLGLGLIGVAGGVLRRLG